MRIFCLTSDKYIHSIKPFCYLLDKYWPDHPPVIICGFSSPTWTLPSGYTWHSIGKFEDYPFHKWSNALIKLFTKDFQDETFIFMLEDYWITRPVYSDQIKILGNFIKMHHDIIKVDLCADRRHADGVKDYITYNRIPLVMSDPLSPYQMSVRAGIWRRKLLLKVLVPDESPHDTEIMGTVRLSQMPYNVIGTKSWIPGDENAMPIHHAIGQMDGDHSKYYFYELNEEDRGVVEGML